MNYAKSTLQAQGNIPAPPPVEHSKAAHWYQHINRYWQSYLSGSELKLLLYIVDAQLGWPNTGPKWISRRGFARGVIGKDGRIWHRGTGLADSTIDAGLASLEDRKIIIVDRAKKIDHTECRYSINRYWEPCRAEKPPKNPTRNSGKPPRISDTPHPEIRGQKESKGKTIKNPNCHSLPDPDECQVREDKEKGKKANRESLVENANPTFPYEGTKTAIDSALSDPNPYPKKLEQIWNNALIETFPSRVAVPWKAKERGMIRQFCERHRQAPNRNKGASFGQFVDWVVRNWHCIMNSEFFGFTGAPEYPSLRFVVLYGDRFLDAMARREEISKEGSMTTRDRMIRTFIRSGQTREGAEKEADEKLGRSDLHDKLAKAQKRLKTAYDEITHLRRNQTFAALRLAGEIPTPKIEPPKPTVIRPIEELAVNYEPTSFPPWEEEDDNDASES